MKLLLAEDDAQVRAELHELLVEEGFQITVAADGIEAYERFREQKDIELLLLDIRMPRCTGLQTLEAIRKVTAKEDRIFEAIFITGNNDKESIVSALKLGALSFLFKPIVVEQLLEEIEQAKDRLNQRRYRFFQRKTLEEQVETKTQQISKLTNEVRGGMGAAVQLLALAAEHFSPGVDLHLHRVAEMSACLARRLGFDQQQCQQIHLASLLHDVGKIGGDAQIYNAERSIDAAEFEALKQHTVRGGQFLAQVNDPVISLAKTIAEQHHENWDGSGYPNHLKGDEIAIEAAVVHIVDVYDNLRAKRPYRDALPHHKALDIIVNGDEKSDPNHFNPRVLQALLAQHRDIEAIYERYQPAD